ncbi:replication-associated recombination protein A [Paenibacillus elgii]|uniref:replication-associated recombination protein A n=1 Tax=Paenibacillus elgii TaxID=189691 RepID=UPI0020406A30|nr:replication-associated recombination protein A [Paenibacillus elgii]MCM3272866.1 replication-associated recombination protein A [Paenibacillus elgii]
MDLFDFNRTNEYKPLAERMRPQNLEQFFGQKHLLGEGKVLRRLIETDKIGSMILQGPPSSGKTTLATIISGMSSSHFEKLNGVSLSVSDLREVARKAKDNLKLYNQRTILFLDEIHALKSNVQESLLPIVEDGTIILIGATTESIAHDIIPPLVSRCRVYRFEALQKDDLEQILRQALADPERGLGGEYGITQEAMDYLCDVCNGDVRNALIALETAAYSLHDSQTIELQTIQESFESRINAITHTDFYDMTSAFCKSLRGGQTDAAIYWLARMLYSGVDPLYICRRIVVHATEDVGMANPTALQIALAAKDAVEFVGMPEARMAIAEAVVFICESPKSNAVYKAINGALDYVKQTKAYEVPADVRDGTRTYTNPIDHPNARNEYLPPEVKSKRFYHPQNSGVEAKIFAKYNKPAAE